jgi:hypothetical protein
LAATRVFVESGDVRQKMQMIVLTSPSHE